jgi:hypothetical protein
VNTPEKPADREATEQEKQDYINALRLEAEILKAQLKRKAEDDDSDVRA